MRWCVRAYGRRKEEKRGRSRKNFSFLLRFTWQRRSNEASRSSKDDFLPTRSPANQEVTQKRNGGGWVSPEKLAGRKTAEPVKFWLQKKRVGLGRIPRPTIFFLLLFSFAIAAAESNRPRREGERTLIVRMRKWTGNGICVSAFVFLPSLACTHTSVQKKLTLAQSCHRIKTKSVLDRVMQKIAFAQKNSSSQSAVPGCYRTTLHTVFGGRER